MKEKNMEAKRKRRRLAQIDTGLCAACGCCVKVCPKRAIDVFCGLYARINEEKCVGCGLCARECPASIISLAEVEA